MTVIAQVPSTADWRVDQIANDPDWRLPLHDGQRLEILAALAAAQAAGVRLDNVSREVFPLPTLGPQLERLARDVGHGRGFALVQGVPVDALTEEQCALVAVGVASIDASGRLSTRYGPDYMHSAQRAAHVPPLSAEQLEALETLDQLSHDPRFLLTMDLHPGDLQFLNNHVILHSRTAYEDYPEPQRRRHLIRLWLNL